MYNMGGSSVDMYGPNPMRMGVYGQMPNSGPFGNQYGIDPSMSMMAPYQQYQAPAFVVPYNNLAFQPLIAAGGSQGAPGMRTIFIGNLPAECTIDEVLNLVRSGLVESARLLPEKNCAFVYFVDPSAAAAFHHEGTLRGLSLEGRELRIGWGNQSPVPPLVLQAVQQGATRNVFLGGIDVSVTEDGLRADFSQFGPIDTIRILHDKNIAFVHLTSVASAMKAVATLSNDPRYAGRRVNYGKDRCAKQGAGTATGGVHGAFTLTPGYAQFGGPANMAFNPVMGGFPAGRAGGVATSGGSNISEDTLVMKGNRTVYLGNLSDQTTCEDLCNMIRGGILSKIRIMPQKHNAFVTFVDPQAASSFHDQATQGISLHGRCLKVGWGTNAHTHTLSHQVVGAVRQGATRNVYIGAINESFTEERLRLDFAQFGETELVNILREKNCGFVNFTSIESAVKAVEGIRRNPAYANVKVGFGRDRCGNPSRTPKVNLNKPSNEQDQSTEDGNGAAQVNDDESNTSSESNFASQEDSSIEIILS